MFPIISVRIKGKVILGNKGVTELLPRGLVTCWKSKNESVIHDNKNCRIHIRFIHVSIHCLSLGNTFN